MIKFAHGYAGEEDLERTLPPVSPELEAKRLNEYAAGPARLYLPYDGEDEESPYYDESGAIAISLETHQENPGFFFSGDLVEFSDGQAEDGDTRGQANARRFAACWNAFIGVSTQAIEANPLNHIRQTLEAVREHLTNPQPGTNVEGLLMEVTQAINSVENNHKPVRRNAND